MKNQIRLSVLLLALASGHLRAQQTVPEPADTLASFPGGDAAFERYITDNLLTTREALTRNITGDIDLSFVINQQGYPEDIKVLKRLGYGCDEQAARLLRKMPRWQPGVIAGRRIRTTLQHSFHFSPQLKPGEEQAGAARETIPDAALQFGKDSTDFADYISGHYIYPANAPKNMEGSLVLRFKVNEDGSVSDIRVVAGLDRDFDNEAIRMLSGMPHWLPKQKDFKPVASYKDLVIGFRKKKALLYQL